MQTANLDACNPNISTQLTIILSSLKSHESAPDRRQESEEPFKSQALGQQIGQERAQRLQVTKQIARFLHQPYQLLSEGASSPSLNADRGLGTQSGVVVYSSEPIATADEWSGAVPAPASESSVNDHDEYPTSLGLKESIGLAGLFVQTLLKTVPDCLDSNAVKMALSIVKTIIVIKDVRYLITNMSMTISLNHVQQIGDNTDSLSKSLSNTEVI